MINEFDIQLRRSLSTALTDKLREETALLSPYLEQKQVSMIPDLELLRVQHGNLSARVNDLSNPNYF